MHDSIMDRLPTVEEVERALAENRQNASLLRSFRFALKRRKLQQSVSKELRRLVKTTDESEARHEA